MKNPDYITAFAVLGGCAIMGVLLIGVGAFRDVTAPQFEPLPHLRPGMRPVALNLTSKTVSSENSKLQLIKSEADAPAADVAGDLSGLQNQNEELSDTNAKLKTQLQELLNWILVNFRGKVPLEEKNIERLQFPVATDDFMLHPEVADFLNMSETEAGLVNDILAYARMGIRELQDANLSMEYPSDSVAVINIPPFPDDGDLLKEDIYAALEATLGADRFDRFVQVSEEGINDQFDRFGDGSRTLSFEVIQGNGIAPQYVINDTWLVQEGDNMLKMTTTEQLADEIPQKYADFTYWLPEEFQTQ